MAQSTSNEFRVAYIGVGNRGSYTMRQIMKVPGVKLVAVCDLDPQRVQAALDYITQQGGSAKGYDDYRKMLAEMKDIDGVVIATPIDTHKNLAIGVLEAGKHVYLEKPVAIDADEALVVEKAAQSAKGILQVGFQLRHDPSRAAAIKFIQSGGIGDVLYCHAMRHSGDLPRNTAWLFDKKRSGDIIVEQACHIIDLMIWAVGKPPVRAMGSGGINLFKDVPPGRSVMDNWSCIWEFDNGVRFNFSQIYFDPAGFTGTQEKVFGSKGAIDLAKAAWAALETTQRPSPLVQLEVVSEPGKPADYYSMEAFVDNARGKKRPLNNIQAGNISTKAAVMGRMAIEQKRIVTWNELA